MVARRTCSQITGGRCGATPLRESDLCFWHDPDHAEEAAQARRLGGQRRRREGIVRGTYEIESLDTVADLWRLLVVATVDALALDNSVARIRVLTSIVQAGSRLLETGELEERLAALEDAIGSRPDPAKERLLA